MMDPVCFMVFGHAVRWYGVMLAAGFGAGLFHLSRLDRREGRPPGFAADLAFWIIIGGIVGARIAFVLSSWDHFSRHPADILRVDQGGLVYYGGFFGAGAAILAVALARKTSFLGLVDYTLTALPLGHALGRIGCFLNGCCQGAPHEGWLSCSYTPGAPVWPVQLFEAAANLAIYAILFALYRRKPVAGSILALYLMLYSVARFSLEFLRGDKDDRVTVSGLTSAQWVSLGLFAGGLLLAYILRLRKRHDALHRPA